MNQSKWNGKWYSHAIPCTVPPHDSFNLQQHVLLVLLKDSTDVLEDVLVKQVYTTIYDITHKGAWFFHIMQDLKHKGKAVISR